MVTLWASAFLNGNFDRSGIASRHLRPTETVMIDIGLGDRARQYMDVGSVNLPAADGHSSI
jgi:hypothetical protein